MADGGSGSSVGGRGGAYTRVAGPRGSSAGGGGDHSGAAGRLAGGAFSSRLGSLEIARSAGGLTGSGASAAPGRASDSTLRKPFTSGSAGARGAVLASPGTSGEMIGAAAWSRRARASG